MLNLQYKTKMKRTGNKKYLASVATRTNFDSIQFDFEHSPMPFSFVNYSRFNFISSFSLSVFLILLIS